LIRHLEKIGLSEIEVGEQLRAFWQKVQAEMNRIAYQGHSTGGAA
jgi:hypothetical protein